MEAKERFSAVRKHYNLSMNAFGERIGLSASGVSAIEYGTRAMNEKHIKLICAEFPEVNENWLRCGDGDMISKPSFSDSDPLEALREKHKLSPVAFGIVKSFVEMDGPQREQLLAIARKLFSSADSVTKSIESAARRSGMAASEIPNINPVEENQAAK